MLCKFLDPKNDVAFKKIFGTEKNKAILIHFLNDVIDFRGGGVIQEVTFLKTTQEPQIAAQKTSLVDILCTDEQGRRYIVEMQVAKDRGFAKRAQYYASKVYASQMQAGQPFHDLKEVIFLAIVDFVMFPSKQDYKSDHVILDKKSYENDLKDFSFTFIELPKFTKPIEELSGMIEKWAYFFKHAAETSEEALPQLVGEDEILERAYEELNSLRWREEELLTYEQAEMQEKVYYGALEQKLYEGFEKGFGKGKTEGIVQGRSEGIAEGIEIEREKVILEMLAQHLPDSTIASIMKVPLETIQTFKARMLQDTKNSSP
jgi:predicted transposase/invertase (TIGR01784 family)